MSAAFSLSLHVFLQKLHVSWWFCCFSCYLCFVNNALTSFSFQTHLLAHGTAPPSPLRTGFSLFPHNLFQIVYWACVAIPFQRYCGFVSAARCWFLPDILELVSACPFTPLQVQLVRTEPAFLLSCGFESRIESGQFVCLWRSRSWSSLWLSNFKSQQL